MTIRAAANNVCAAMNVVANALEAVNKVLDVSNVPQTLLTFRKENEQTFIAQEIVDDSLENTLDLSETKSESSESKNQDLDETKTAVDSTLDGPSPRTKQSITKKDHQISALGLLFLAIITVFVVVEYFGLGFFFV